MKSRQGRKLAYHLGPMSRERFHFRNNDITSASFSYLLRKFSSEDPLSEFDMIHSNPWPIVWMGMVRPGGWKGLRQALKLSLPTSSTGN